MKNKLLEEKKVKFRNKWHFVGGKMGDVASLKMQ
jgi:hypothetical protein